MLARMTKGNEKLVAATLFESCIGVSNNNSQMIQLKENSQWRILASNMKNDTSTFPI